jgi:hypothetical protein
VLVAVRDKETRLYFAGYQPYAFKVFAFTLAAVLAAAGGMLYSPQVTIISPHNMRVEESILMVIWVALGGRGRLWGAIFGSLLVNYTYAALTSDMPAVWPFVQGAMFLAVVLLFPGGLVGLWDRFEKEVASGAGVVRSAFALLPLAVLVLFVLGEALGLTPDVLRTVGLPVPGVGPVKLKYVLVIALVLVAVGYHLGRSRRPAAVEEPASSPADPVAEGGAA